MATTALTFNVDLSKATSPDQNVMDIKDVSFTLTTERNGKVKEKFIEGDNLAFPAMLSYLRSIGTTRVVTWHLGFMVEYIQRQLELSESSLGEFFRIENPELCLLNVGNAYRTNPANPPRLVVYHVAERNNQLMLADIRFTDLMRERYALQRALRLPPDKTYAFSAIAKRADIVPKEAEGLKGRELYAYKMQHTPELVKYEAFEENRRLLIIDKAHRSVEDCLNYDFS